MNPPLSTPEPAGGVTLRPASPGDVALILGLIRELADYEKLAHQVEATHAQIEEALFGPDPRVFCDLACWKDEVGGFALWFYNFSTFRGRHGIYLEDLFVRPAFRRFGLGKTLLKALARRCATEALTRLEWSVLDWNAPAIDFYRAQGAVLLDDWTTCRLTGEALTTLGAPA